MAPYLILISSFMIYAVFGEKILEPKKRCVPTANIQGACHKCVCLMDGIYHCQGEPCRDIERLNPQQHECQPLELYREDSTFCACSATGHWRSVNCRMRFHRLTLRKDPIKQYLRTNIPCKPNHLYITDCDVCHCGSNGVITFNSCTNRPCNKKHKGDICKPGDVYRSANEFCVCSYLNYYIDNMCIKVSDAVVQRIPIDSLAEIMDFREKRTTIDLEYCDGNTIYIDCNMCVCEKNRFVCSKYDCDDEVLVLRSGGRKVLELKSEHDKCVPGWNYRYKCNTCVCNMRGEPLCTSMICLQDVLVDSASLRQMILSY